MTCSVAFAWPLHGFYFCIHHFGFFISVLSQFIPSALCLSSTRQDGWAGACHKRAARALLFPEVAFCLVRLLLRRVSMSSIVCFFRPLVRNTRHTWNVNSEAPICILMAVSNGDVLPPPPMTRVPFSTGTQTNSSPHPDSPLIFVPSLARSVFSSFLGECVHCFICCDSFSHRWHCAFPFGGAQCPSTCPRKFLNTRSVVHNCTQVWTFRAGRCCHGVYLGPTSPSTESHHQLQRRLVSYSLVFSRSWNALLQ